jgi:hypothetical protein
MKQQKHFLESNDDVTRIHDVTAGAHPQAPRGRQDDGRAFLPDPYGESDVDMTLDDAAAEDMARDFVAMATTGGADVSMEAHDAVTEEEEGGPFVEEAERIEFADDVDGNNPPDATREPFPAPMRGENEPRASGRGR